jgi:hypothetical protein
LFCFLLHKGPFSMTRHWNFSASWIFACSRMPNLTQNRWNWSHGTSKRLVWWAPRMLETLFKRFASSFPTWRLSTWRAAPFPKSIWFISPKWRVWPVWTFQEHQSPVNTSINWKVLPSSTLKESKEKWIIIFLIF